LNNHKVINKPKTDPDNAIGLFFQFAIYSLSAVCTNRINPATTLRVSRNAPLEKLIIGRKANNPITERIMNERTYEKTFLKFMLFNFVQRYNFNDNEYSIPRLLQSSI
jgi:hypothetical protein